MKDRSPALETSLFSKHNAIYELLLLPTGISLNPEQWNQLKEQISEIDDAIKSI